MRETEVNCLVIDIEFQFVVFIDYENPNPMTIRFLRGEGIYNANHDSYRREISWKRLQGLRAYGNELEGGMRSTCHVVIGFHLTWRQVNLDGPGGLCQRASLTKELEICNGASDAVEFTNTNCQKS